MHPGNPGTQPGAAMNKRKRVKGKEKEDEQRKESRVIKLAFSVPEAPGGLLYLYTLAFTLRSSPCLPLLTAKFSKEKWDMLDFMEDGRTIFMDRDIDVFKTRLSSLESQLGAISVRVDAIQKLAEGEDK